MSSKLHSKTVNLRDLKRAHKFLDDSFVNAHNEITDKDKVYTKDTKGDTILRDLPEDFEQATVDETVEYIKGNIYSINTRVMNGSFSGALKIRKGGQASITILPNTNYMTPKSATDIKVTNASVASYDRTTGILVIENPTKDVIIDIECPITVYNITCQIYNGTYAGNTEVEIFNNGRITVIANEHFKIPDVVEVTGSTDYTYDKNTGTIDIYNVTQNIEIKAYCIIENGFSVTPLEDNCAMLIFIYVDDLQYTDFQYSFDGAHWEVYPHEWYAVQLLKGQKVFVRNTKNRLCVDTSHYVRVNIQSNEPSRKFRPFKAEGDLAALINYGPLYEGCFANMFWCTEVVSMPKLPPPPEDTGTYPKNTFMNMFAGCKSLKYLSEIPAITDLNKYEFYSMFYGCNLVKLREESGYGNYLFTCPEYIEWEPKSSAIEDMFNGCNAGEFKGDYPRPLKSYYWYLSVEVTKTIINGTFDRDLTELIAGKPETIKIIPNLEYTYPESITVTGCDYTYDKTTGEITLTTDTDDNNVSIVVECPEIPFGNYFATDTMEEISDQCRAGNHRNRYRIGEQKTFVVNGFNINFTILDFDYDGENTITVGMTPWDGYYDPATRTNKIDTNRWKTRLCMYSAGVPYLNYWSAATNSKKWGTAQYYLINAGGDIKHYIENFYSSNLIKYSGVSINNFIQPAYKICVKRSEAYPSRNWIQDGANLLVFPYSATEIAGTVGLDDCPSLPEGAQYEYFKRWGVKWNTVGSTIYFNNGADLWGADGWGRSQLCYGSWLRTPSHLLACALTIAGADAARKFNLIMSHTVAGASDDYRGITFAMALGEIKFRNITSNITNGTVTGDTKINKGATATVRIIPNEDYLLPETVEVSNCEYTYDNTTGIITLSKAIRDVTIKATCTLVPFTNAFATDSFEEISEYCRTGAHAFRYRIGEEKVIPIDGVDHIFTILGINHDAENSITIGLSPFDGYWDPESYSKKLDTKHWQKRIYRKAAYPEDSWNIKWASDNSVKQYNKRQRYTLNSGTFDETNDLKRNLEQTILPQVKAAIGSIGYAYLKTITKPCAYYDGSNWQLENYSCQIFPFSQYEVYGVNLRATIEGKQYNYFNKVVGTYTEGSKDIKVNEGSIISAMGAHSQAIYCNLRTPVSDYDYNNCIIDNSGEASHTSSGQKVCSTVFGIVIGARPMYTITKNATNCVITGDDTIKVGDNVSLTVSVKTGYMLPDVVSVTGAKYTYDQNTGIIVLNSPTKNVTVTVEGYVPMWWDDTASLTEADIGKTEEILVDGITHRVVLIGIDHDDLADGSGKAHTTWQLDESFSSSSGERVPVQWNPSIRSPYYNIYYDGTNSCALRNWLNSTGKSYLPARVQRKIKPVIKKTTNGYMSSAIHESVESLFVLSIHEVVSSTSIDLCWGSGWGPIFKQEGEQYKYYADRVPNTNPYNWDTTLTPEQKAVIYKKPKSGTDYIWLRTPDLNYNQQAHHIRSTCYITYSLVTDSHGVAPAFCI